MKTLTTERTVSPPVLRGLPADIAPRFEALARQLEMAGHCIRPTSRGTFLITLWTMTRELETIGDAEVFALSHNLCSAGT